ncbi:MULTISPECIES: aromatic ring-hydroxylating dioxygenase subunit alpha [unclassified Lysinibacillus]|uniref:aromatic ring-hydroxylating oxygenase subunit alpha n=1 Tax=unclassified Lysinibacillus TaxID=2636778 RepID=UPI002011BD07|nr:MULTISPECIES: aromatic ring-hydroxylating dioxygenase subunit alpha [unclassified Lysinibacillus]MCL1696708.1 aromatic ring-hydroxylating dioxygenase subunit alpha [Lysinibacillus sp. BPa_S21]MCL1698811.1 aromatic ring-hydroxylating dioxygenase subunit alpha [Lysinibacillus sp. Bpr_S20]
MAYNKVQDLSNKVYSRIMPYEMYTSPAILEEEKKHIFNKTWHLVGHLNQVQENGQFFTADVLGEPIIITRGFDSELRAFYNVCPHRATKLEKQDSGKRKIFTCMYHGWSFKTDGSLNRAPNFPSEDECVKDACLRTIRLETMSSLIFINFDEEAKPLIETYGDLHERLEKLGFLSDLTFTYRKTRHLKANWKAFNDNYLECDHCHVAHPSFIATLDMDAYQIFTCENYSFQTSIVQPDKQMGDVDLDSAELRGGEFYWLYPNLMLTVYPGPGNIASIELVPIDHENTTIVYTYYFREDSLEKISQEERDLMSFAEQVRVEDIELVELEQIGFKSQAFTKGHYSPSELAIVQFHHLVMEALGK